MPTSPKVALITVSYDSAQQLSEYWCDVDLPEDAEWIVVDNASHDLSPSVAEELGAKVVRSTRNRGFAAGCNLGAQATDADVLFFVNPDLRISAEGVTALAAEVRRSGGIVAPQLLNTDGTLQENGRGAPFLWRKVLHRLGLPDFGYSKFVPRDEIASVVWVTGAALAISRADFETLGGWDEGFFLYDEDVDLGLRALQAGLTSRVLGAVRWTHEWERASVSAFAKKRGKAIITATLRLYRKHPYALIPVGRQAQALRARDAVR